MIVILIDWQDTEVVAENDGYELSKIHIVSEPISLCAGATSVTYLSHCTENPMK